jgi:3-deoxy-D-manno-octulosonate 8-phosphate phosphatase (KDO 8-P phosphatase)
MDVDGVLTDGTVQIASDGTESKVFSILDGMGLVRLEQARRRRAWISGRPSGRDHPSRRGTEDPAPDPGSHRQARPLAGTRHPAGTSNPQCAYMGDDDIDAAAIAWAGVGVSVPDAMPAALKAAALRHPRPPAVAPCAKSVNILLAARGLRFPQ